MKKETVSSPADSGGAGMSEPVFRKGIVCRAGAVFIREAPLPMSKATFGVIEGTELELLEAVKGFYKVSLLGNAHPGLVGYIPSQFVKEVQNDGKYPGEHG